MRNSPSPLLDTDVLVYCNGSGDYEWEIDRWRWTMWINNHIGSGLFMIHGTEIYDQAKVRFNDAEMATFFRLSKPEYVTDPV